MKKQGTQIVYRKIFLVIPIFIMSILILNSVVALELNPFADTKEFTTILKEDTSSFLKEEYNTKYGVITLNSNFMWVDTGKIAEYSLTNTSESIINLEMYGRATTYKTGTLFDGVVYKDKFGNYINSQVGKYYILDIKKVVFEVPDKYKEVCALNKTSGKDECSSVPDTYKNLSRTEKSWIEYKGEELAPNNYTWKFEGKRSIGQVIDIQPVKSDTEFTEWVWFNTSWPYKQRVNISAGESNYSVKLNVTWTANMNVTFKDLRFTDYTETSELPYWIENYTSGVNANVWVKVDLNSTTNIIYMYYGNHSTATTSNIKTAFLVGDDFADGSIDTAIWNVSGSITETAGYLNFTDKGTLTSKQNYSIGNGLSIKFTYIDNATSPQTDQMGIAKFGDPTAVQSAGKVGIREYDPGKGYMVAETGSGDVGQGSARNNPHTYECFENLTFQSCYRFDTNSSKNSSGTVTNIPVSASFYSDASKKTIINVTMRKRVNFTSDPVSTFGAEESQTPAAGITITNERPANGANFTTNASVLFGCNLTGTGTTNITAVTLNVTGTATWNQSVTGLNTQSYNATFLNTTIVNGTYSWNCIGYGTDANASSTVISFNQKAYTLPSVDFKNQTPADLDSLNGIGGVNITYNVSSSVGIPINGSTIKLYLKTNSTTRNTVSFLNGTGISGYIPYTPTTNNSLNYTWGVDDDEVYPTISNLNSSIMHNALHYEYPLNSINTYSRIRFYNVTNTTTFNYLMIMVNASTTANTLNFYYCNSSYISGNVITTPNCGVVSQWDPTPLFNVTNNQSKYKLVVLTINTTSGTVDGIKVTPDSSFLVRGTNTGSRNIYYVNTTARTDTSQTSTNNGIDWTNQSFTFDVSLHQFSGNSSIYYYACANDTNNNEKCSDIRTDLLTLGNLPPSSPHITSPTNTTYSDILPFYINYTAAVSPNGYDITNYNITLWNAAGTFNQSIKAVNGQNLSYTFNVTNLFGSFFIRVRANDTLNQQSVGESDVFAIISSSISYGASTPANNTNTTNRNLTVFVDYASSDVVNLTIDLFDSNHVLLNSSLNTTGATSYNVTFQNLTVGTYYYNATITSSTNSKLSTSTRKINIDYVLPYFTLNSLPNVTTPTLPVSTLADITTTDANLYLCGYNSTLYTGWNKKQEVKIQERTGVTQTNYSVLIAVTYDADMNADFSDLRFTDSTNTINLPYWIENYTASTSANVWVKVPALAASVNTSIYMYYGNAGASSQSSILNAFIVGDNFAGSSLNTSIWSGTASVANNMANLSAGQYIQGVATALSSDGLRIDFWVLDAGTAAEDQFGMSKIGDYVATNGTEGKVGIRQYDNPTNLQAYMVSELGSANLGTTTGTRAAWRNFYCLTNSTTLQCGRKDNSQTQTFTGSPNATHITASMYAAVNGKSVTNVTMRKFSSPEPSVSIQAETGINPVYYTCNTPFNVSTSSSGVNNLTVMATDYMNNTNYTTYSYTVFYVQTSTNQSSVVNEGDLTNYTLNLTMNSLSNYPANAALYYDGVFKGYGTPTNNSDSIIFNITITIPTVITSTANWTWYYNIGGAPNVVNWNVTGTQTQSGFIYELCSTTNNVSYLNLTFKDESSLATINASVTSSSWDYYFNGSETKTYTFSNATENARYSFCFTPPDKTIYVTPDLIYSGTGYIARSYKPGNITLTNSTTNQVLYLLSSSTGIYVTFQVGTVTGQTISGASINVSNSVLGAIESRITDDSGIATFFLNPTTTYTITFSADGYVTQTVSITPTQSSYSIQLLSTSGGTTINDTFRGITYTFEPVSPYLYNQTSYEFNFTITSSYSTLDSFGFNITNSSGTSFGNASSTNPLGGVLRLTRNTGLNSTFIVNGFWVIDGNYTYVSKTYIITSNVGYGTSIANLRDRVRLYLGSGGFFGLKPFGLNIIVFLIIFVTTGLFSYRFSITSPAAILLIMFILTMLFDYMNLITYSSRFPEDAASMIMGILAIGYGIKEAAT